MILPLQANAKAKDGLDALQGEKICRYVKDRQNQDGGYTFAQWTGSSAQDTYFALEILQMLGTAPDHREETTQFLEGLQNSDGSYESIKVAYYCTSALSNLHAKPLYDVTNFANSLKRSHGGFGSANADAETSSEFETTYFALFVLKSLDEIEQDRVARFIVERVNPDGTFGSGSGYSTLASVHFAIASLELLGCDVRSLKRTLEWLRRCELRNGGFTNDPRDTFYLVLEDTYYGLNSLRHLGVTPLYPQSTIQLVKQFQNGNGGFRRSIFMGISTFESTFHALSCLQILASQIEA